MACDFDNVSYEDNVNDYDDGEEDGQDFHFDDDYNDDNVDDDDDDGYGLGTVWLISIHRNGIQLYEKITKIKQYRY